jgi:uncharacterized membrane protein YheB (UPF0754 family)
LATNWLALKWIFQPVDPLRVTIGPFSWTLQGKFLRRQPEVSATFANYFSRNILTANKIWAAVLSDPQSRPNVQRLLAVELQAFLNENLTPAGFNEFPLLNSEEIAQISKKAMEQLPKHLPVLYPYMDVALGLEDTLRVKMEAMTSRRFERVLHPIFEEDELTLILAGAGLGFGAGLVQQGLETGYLVLPKLPRIVERLGKKCGKFFRPPSVLK